MSDGIDALELALQLEHEEVLLLRAQRDRLRSDYNLLLGETQMLRELTRRLEAKIQQPVVPESHKFSFERGVRNS